MVNFCDRFVDLCVIDFSVGILILPLPLDVIDFMIVVGGIYFLFITKIPLSRCYFLWPPVQKTSKSQISRKLTSKIIFGNFMNTPNENREIWHIA